MSMIYLIFCLICFGASAVGAVCGIGGGVIIKPVLDAFHILDISTISFLSGCTVLSMTTYSVIRGRLSGESSIETAIGLPLALGAAAGGLAGKNLFSLVSKLSPDPDLVGAIQAACLLGVTFATLIYVLNKSKITTRKVRGLAACIFIGICLGVMSSFLGIGGGPINLVVFYFFFSMSTKTAAQNSLYVIFFSQAASLIASICTGKVPEFPAVLLALMVAGGIFGGIAGRAVNKKIAESTVDRLFIGIMVLIMLICVYNIWQLT